MQYRDFLTTDQVTNKHISYYLWTDFFVQFRWSCLISVKVRNIDDRLIISWDEGVEEKKLTGQPIVLRVRSTD